MRLSFFLALLLTSGLLTAGAAHAQRTVDVRLPTPRPLAEAARITVVDVFDLRTDTTLGTARTGITNRRRPLALVGGTVPAVAAYLRALAPASDGAQPVAVGIETLALSEQATLATEFARAEVALRFFVVSGDSLAEVGHGTALAERSGLDVTRYHAETTAEALTTALAQFVTSGAETAPQTFVARNDIGSMPAQTAERADSSAAQPLGDRAPLTAQAERSTRSFFGVGAIRGRNAVGGRALFGTRRNPEADWSFPLVAELQILDVENEEAGLQGLFLTYGTTIQAAYRLGGSPLALQFGGGVSGGNEQIDGDAAKFFFGGRVNLDLAVVPVGSGFAASVGVYGSRLFGSRLYPNDVGATVTIGAQF